MYMLDIYIFMLCCSRKRNVNKYQYLLETPKNYSFGMETINSIDLKNSLVTTIDKFCTNNNVYENGAIVSLSGGVDSMVVLAILIRLSLIHCFPIYACSIDYNNRDEQEAEIEFLIDYCKFHKIDIYIRKVDGMSRKKEDSGSRTEYEEESRKIRFDLYKSVIRGLEPKPTGIFVGHHKDDTIENIFTNSMKGPNLLDLEVIKEISNIHDINIYRPLLNHHKQPIYDLAHKHSIPYFLDTTPKWSRRGKMRNEIFPLFDKVFTPSWRLKLKDLGDQSNEWGDFINSYIIDPWVKEVVVGNYGFFMELKEMPKVVYTNVLLKVLHSMHKHMLKSTSVDKIIDSYKNKIYDKHIGLDSGMVMFIDSEIPDFCIIYHKDELQNKFLTGPVKMNNTIHDFINGNITYNVPKNITGNIFTVNKKRYDEMDIKLPLELIKGFSFPS